MSNFTEEEKQELGYKKGEFKSALLDLRNDLDFLAEEIASAMDTPTNWKP